MIPNPLLANIPLGDTTQGIQPIEFYSKNQKPDWNVYMSVPELKKHCKLWGIKLRENPSVLDCEMAAKELGEKMQGITSAMF